MSEEQSISPSVIADFEGYGITRDGKPWSRMTKESLGRWKGTKSVVGTTWKPMKPGRSGSGYRMVILRKNNKSHMRYIHVLVLEAFVGPRPKGMVACHNDGNKENNCVENLRWGTRQSNEADKAKHMTKVQGAKHFLAKMDDDIVRCVRERHAAGITQQALADLHGVDQVTISQVITGKTWKHVV